MQKFLTSEREHAYKDKSVTQGVVSCLESHLVTVSCEKQRQKLANCAASFVPAVIHCA